MPYTFQSVKSMEILTDSSKLYASFGFIETGEKDGEEQIAVLKL